MCCPLSPWYPADYKNGFPERHGPPFAAVSPDVFAFSFSAPSAVPRVITSCHIVMTNCLLHMSYRHVVLSCHLVIHILTNLIRIHLDNIYMKQLTTIQSIKFYTYKQLLYILIQFNIINYNQKNKLLIDYYETQCNNI